MFGNGAKFVGSPIGSVNSAGLTNNSQQNQQPTTRNLWPTATAFQGGDFTVPISDTSLLSANSVTPQPSYLSSFPIELIKNWNSNVLGLSQVSNSSIFVQTQSADIVNNTFTQTITSTSSPTQVRRNDTIESWEPGSLVEPLHISLPITTASIKAEHPSNGSTSSTHSRSSRTDKKSRASSKKCNKNLNEIILNQHASNNTICEITKVEPITPIVAGCSRTVPLTWHHGFHQYETSISNPNKVDHYVNQTSNELSTRQLLQIKTEPCQVSEVTTSNNFITTTSLSASPALIKIEQKSPTTSTSSSVSTVPVTSTTTNMDLQTGNNLVQQNNGATIPIGIAVGRQRLQETSQTLTTVPQLQSKDLNRFNMGLDLGATTIPLTDVMHQNHQNLAMTQNRAPTTLLQYPTAMPMEIPSMPPPVGFQLVRDPVSGQLIFFPTSGLSTIESIPQTLVWPSYHQAATQSALQPPQLLLPSLQQSLQPPPLALLGSDYLSANCASTTLHQSHLQHTSTHSTRLVSMNASDTSKRHQKCATLAMPMPAATQTFVKIEDSHHQQPLVLEHEKSMPAVSVASTALQTSSDIGAQVFYQHPGLIQLTQAQPVMAHHQTSSVATNMSSDYRPQKSSPPPLQLTTQTMTVNSQHSNFSHFNRTCNNNNNIESKLNNSSHSNETCYNVVPSCPPEVQDANIQTSPVMSEDDNSNDQDDDASRTDTEEKMHEISAEEHPILSHSILDIVKPDETKTEENVEQNSSVPEPEANRTSTSMPVIIQKIESTESDDCKGEEMLSMNNEPEEQKEPVDLSGLQLLSNSIDVFQHTSVKREPSECRKTDAKSLSMPMTSIITPIQNHEKMQLDKPITPPQPQQHIPEDLGGLTLLCALAEQRLEEDFHNNQDDTPILSESNAATPTECNKKKKHKMKTSKKSKHKEERKAKKRKHSSSADISEDFKGEMAESLKRVKTKFDLPVSSVVFNLMENDMKIKLESITRQLEEKKRELEQISTTEPAEKTCPSPSSTSTNVVDQKKSPKMSYLGSAAAPLKFSIVPSLSPFSSSSSNSESIVDIPKLSMSSDTSDSGSKDGGEANSSKILKRSKILENEDDEQKNDKLEDKKVKSSIMFSSKYNLVSSSPTLGSWTSSISKNGKASLPFVKQEEYGGIIKESAFKDNRVFSIFGEGYQQKFQPSTPLTLSLTSRTVQPTIKNHSKHKKHKERRRHKEKKRPDSRCSITPEHLKQQKTRVLMSQGGLFYAGSLSPVEQNEIFAITLDGERGNRPHIMSQEEILKQVILEVQPKSISECPPGTRLCAYWSQQYRCLYPGMATTPGSPDVVDAEKYVDVEFDDGDSGRILLDHVRILPNDFALFEYDPNPLQSIHKRKRSAADDEKSPLENPLSREERKKMKKMRKDKTRLIESSMNDEAQDSHNVAKSFEKKHKKKHKCRDDVCGHRKHKKRRKHKKHHHRNSDEEDRELQNHVQNAMSISNDSNNNEEEFEEEDSMSLDDSVTQYEIVKKVDSELNIKEDDHHESNTMESSITESSGSLYNPKQAGTAHCSTDKLNRSNESGSKMAAFLPARQLWAWCGKGIKRSTGRVKKQFYRSIQRGKEVITIGDSAVFLSTGRPDRPYIGKIESLWETANGGMVVRVKWFYHPEETQGCPNLKYPGALFESPHEDENDIQTISHKCEVLEHNAYVKKFGSKPKNYESIYENNDTYYLAGHYDPTLYHMKMQPEIPFLPKNQKWT